MYLHAKGSYIIYRMGVKNFGRVAKGGRKILDASRRGGEKFWTRPEGGAKNFGRVSKGGRKISDLIYIFQITEIQCFLEFLCVLG